MGWRPSVRPWPAGRPSPTASSGTSGGRRVFASTAVEGGPAIQPESGAIGLDINEDHLALAERPTGRCRNRPAATSARPG